MVKIGSALSLTLKWCQHNFKMLPLLMKALLIFWSLKRHLKVIVNIKYSFNFICLLCSFHYYLCRNFPYCTSACIFDSTNIQLFLIKHLSNQDRESLGCNTSCCYGRFIILQTTQVLLLISFQKDKVIKNFTASPHPGVVSQMVKTGCFSSLMQQSQVTVELWQYQRCFPLKKTCLDCHLCWVY